MSDSEITTASGPDHATESTMESALRDPHSNSVSSFRIWPPSQRTRDAIISRLIETLTTPSVLSKRYGSLPADDAAAAARTIEREAFTVAEGAASADGDGIETLHVYSKDISKRMLEAVKSRAGPAPAPVPVEGKMDSSEEEKLFSSFCSIVEQLIVAAEETEQPPAKKCKVGAKNKIAAPTKLVELHPITDAKILTVNPSFINNLLAQGVLGYRRSSEPKTQILELNCTELRGCMLTTLTHCLKIAYCEKGSVRESCIESEMAKIVPVTVDVCMTALYAKLRSIHQFFGPLPVQYSTAPSYIEDVELPLPYALAIQDLGMFEKSCLQQNLIMVPTFPPGTEHEGRANEAYNVFDYMLYVPVLKELGFRFKSIDSSVKAGSPWWTYKVMTVYGTADLACTLPPSLYPNYSVTLRMLFVVPNSVDDCTVPDIIQHAPDTMDYGRHAKELRYGTDVRTFLALSHFPSEWWS